MAKMNLGAGAEKRGNYWEIPIRNIEIRDEDNFSRAYPVGQSKDDRKGIETLAMSIMEQGQEQPCIGDLSGTDGKVRLKVGFRRGAAALWLDEKGLSENHKLLIEVREKEITVAEAMALNIGENAQRKDMTPMDIAAACGALKEKEFNGKDIARIVNISEPEVSKHLAFLKLDKKTQKMLSNSFIGSTSAYKLSLESPERRAEILDSLMATYGITDADIEKPAPKAAVEPEVEVPSADDVPAGKPAKKGKKAAKKTAKKGKKPVRGAVIAEKDITAAITGKGNQSLNNNGRRTPEIRAAFIEIEADNKRGKYERALATAILAFMAGHKNIKDLGKAFDKNCKPGLSAAQEADAAA